MIEMNLIDRAEVRVEIARMGKSMRSFASDIGISQAYLSQILSGEYKPSPKVALKIAEGLEKELEEIFLINNIDITIKQ